jgi:hypothetical protein
MERIDPGNEVLPGGPGDGAGAGAVVDIVVVVRMTSCCIGRVDPPGLMLAGPDAGAGAGA